MHERHRITARGKDMYAIAINCSPRREGNTHQLLGRVLEPLRQKEWDTELAQLGGRLIRGCTACGACFSNEDKQCVFKDDPFNELMAKMIRADAIIIGSPTYFANVNAETKALLDRAGFVSRANDNLFKGKVGAAVAAVRRAGAVHVVDAINRMYMISHMVIPGSSYWNLGIGLDEGDVQKDDEGLENMKNLGETIDIVAKALAPVRANWPQ